MQGHSVESTLPPLPENGPTVETVAQELEIRGVDNSPVPSATTSREEENEETAEAMDDQPIAAATEGKRTRKKLHLAHSSSNSPAKDPELKDDATSSLPPHVQMAPLRACPLSLMPPPPVAGGIRFGGPGDFPSLSKDDDRYECIDTRFCASSSVTSSCITDSLVFFMQRAGGPRESTQSAYCFP